ncbi:hypothetical protein ACIOGT_38210 [Streptomyces microflavus]|uniref:hypothetical protein n=1 Tax=Streptomyces microflavus TaxID=1919 RepID=UPI0038230A9F
MASRHARFCCTSGSGHDYKIWRLYPGQSYDFKNRPTCGYCLRSVIAGVADGNFHNGTPITNCT